jgi:hypothetical protein
MLETTTLGRMASENEHVKLEFSCKFRSQYLRNNRGQGRKNLRCFPVCSGKAHVERGFCGNSLTVACIGNGITPEDRVFLQVVPETSAYHLEKPKDSTPITFAPPSCYEELEVKIRVNELYRGTSLTQYTDHIYDNDYLCPRRLYEANLETAKNGKVILDSEGRVQFLANPKSWSYAWTSNKHTHMQRHVVRAYFMKFLGYDDDNIRIFKCLGVVDSDPFQVSSSKGAQLSRILNRRNKKFFAAAKSMQKTYRKAKANSIGGTYQKNISAAESNAVATESLLALTRGMSNYHSTYPNLPKKHTFTGNANNYAGIPDMQNKKIVVNNRNHLKGRMKKRAASNKLANGAPKKRGRKPKQTGGKVKAKKEIAEYEALQLLTDAIKSFGESDKSAIGYGNMNNAAMNTHNIALMNGINTNGMMPMHNGMMPMHNTMNNLMNNHHAMQLNYLQQMQPALRGVMPGMHPFAPFATGYGLPHHQGFMQHPGNFMGAYSNMAGMGSMASLEQQSLLQQQQQQQQQQALQAQVFAEQQSLNQQRQQNSSIIPSGASGRTNGNNVTTAKIVVGVDKQ